MDRYGLDALVATSPVNITYFTGYYLWLDPVFKEFMVSPGASSNLFQAYAVFTARGETGLVVNPVTAVNAADLGVRDLYTYGDAGLDQSLPRGTIPGAYRRFEELLQTSGKHETPTDALLALLEDYGLSNARISLETEGLPFDMKETLHQGLRRACIKDCTNLIRLIRAVKTPEEIVRLTGAAEINETAGIEALHLARPGRSIQEVVAHFRAKVAELGADFDHFLFCPEGLGLASEIDYILRENDLLYVDFGCFYNYYGSDTGTTLSLGEPSGPLLERHKGVRASLEAGVQQLRPGTKSSEVRAAMWDTLTRSGVQTAHPHGHGIGLEVRDYPIIVPDNGLHIRDDCIDVPSDLPFEVDMVVNLEVPVYMPGVGSVHTEQSFVITADGCRPLTPQDRAHPVQSEP